MLVRRLGYEIEQQLRGGRVTDAGLLPDGRIGLVLRVRQASRLLAADAFATPPLVTVEDGELGIGLEPGFTRMLAATLRGTVLRSVRAREGDRLLRIRFGSRSRFGVDDELELYLELVPRFGNLVLVKRETVVAAAKEFSLAENPRRAVAAGQRYTPPPLPAAPLVPKLVAASEVDAESFLAFARSDAALRDPLYVYRRDGRIVQAHVVPLSGFADADCRREAFLLDVFACVRGQELGRSRGETVTRRREAIVKRLRARERKLHDELMALGAKRTDVGERDALRSEGERVFATLHELSPEERTQAKERAAKLFTAYKKLGAAGPHIERRERDVRAGLDAIDVLRWEVERVAPEDLDDLEKTVAEFDGRRRPVGSGTRTVSVRRRRRALLEFRTAGGSRIVVGRSPTENAEVTFKVARPRDLWFHARAVPGAHVILARDDRNEPPLQDIAAAASLAAHYSKARASAKVAVDYTLRKFVRKQRDAPPGLVWYTNAQTVTTAPRDSVG
ncbi:MAG: DUF814 domain-containing protein [Candidatus Eremiobacteraeota bacterium]|nr:DUF814 domain-containing protein [Candidatus Eremiobacteraeota bacterium]